MPEGTDLDAVWVLSRGVLEHGASLELTDETRALLSRTAQQVAIRPQDAEEALRDASTAATLLREIHLRIRDGSNRRDDSLARSDLLRGEGDYAGAQQVMRDVLALEIVPFFREQAERTLRKSTMLAEVCATGRINPDLPDRSQIAALAHRIQQGHALELTDDLCAVLRRTAPTAALGEAETEDALRSPEGAAALIGMILSRFQKAEHRFLHSMYGMTSLRDTGDLEGARQKMRDVLAVEVVPQYREMAEEQLRGLDSPPPGT